MASSSGGSFLCRADVPPVRISGPPAAWLGSKRSQRLAQQARASSALLSPDAPPNCCGASDPQSPLVYGEVVVVGGRLAASHICRSPVRPLDRFRPGLGYRSGNLIGTWPY